MSLDPTLPIKLDVTLNEAEGILTGLGELPSKTAAFGLMMKIKAQIDAQLPPQEEAPKAE